MSDVTDKLRDELIASGWRTERAAKDTGVGWYAWKRLEGAVDCRCNDKPPSLVLTPYALTVNGKTWYSSELDVTGEVPSGRWVKLTAYSIPLDEVMGAIPECASMLRNAWNAAAQGVATSASHNTTKGPRDE